jgi:hypothetical protein
MIFDGNLSFYARREFAGRVGVRRLRSDFRRVALKMKQAIAETSQDVLFDIDKGA